MLQLLCAHEHFLFFSDDSSYIIITIIGIIASGPFQINGFFLVSVCCQFSASLLMTAKDKSTMYTPMTSLEKYQHHLLVWWLINALYGLFFFCKYTFDIHLAWLFHTLKILWEKFICRVLSQVKHMKKYANQLIEWQFQSRT